VVVVVVVGGVEFTSGGIFGLIVGVTNGLIVAVVCIGVVNAFAVGVGVVGMVLVTAVGVGVFVDMVLTGIGGLTDCVGTALVVVGVGVEML